MLLRYLLGVRAHHGIWLLVGSRNAMETTLTPQSAQAHEGDPRPSHIIEDSTAVGGHVVVVLKAAHWCEQAACARARIVRG